MVLPPFTAGRLSVSYFTMHSDTQVVLWTCPTRHSCFWRVAQGLLPWQRGRSIHTSEHASPLLQAAIPAIVEAAALAAMQAQRAQGRAIALADELAAQVAAKPGKAFSLKGKARATGRSQLGAAVSPMPQAQGDMPTASGQQGFAAVPHNGTAAAQLSHSGKRNVLAGAKARTLRLLQPAKAQVLLSGP